MRFFEDTVNSIQNPNIEDIIVQAAKDFYRLFGNMFRELGEELSAEMAN